MEDGRAGEDVEEEVAAPVDGSAELLRHGGSPATGRGGWGGRKLVSGTRRMGTERRDRTGSRGGAVRGSI